MGRDSSSRESKLIVNKKNVEPLLGMLDFVGDDDKSAEENLKDALFDRQISFQDKKRGKLFFEVRDEVNDWEYDWDFLNSLAPFMEDGSFYEEIGDYLVVGEFKNKATLEISVYNVDYDEEAETESRGELLETYRYTGDSWLDEEVDDDDEPDEIECRLLPKNDPLKVDPGHWQTKNKAWMAERKEKWAAVEKLLKYKKNKKGMNIVKRYFMRGSLPDWRKVN